MKININQTNMKILITQVESMSCPRVSVCVRVQSLKLLPIMVREVTFRMGKAEEASKPPNC